MEDQQRIDGLDRLNLDLSNLNILAAMESEMGYKGRALITKEDARKKQDEIDAYIATHFRVGGGQHFPRQEKPWIPDTFDDVVVIGRVV